MLLSFGIPFRYSIGILLSVLQTSIMGSELTAKLLLANTLVGLGVEPLELIIPPTTSVSNPQLSGDTSALLRNGCVSDLNLSSFSSNDSFPVRVFVPLGMIWISLVAVSPLAITVSKANDNE